MPDVSFTGQQEDAIRWKQQDACIVAGPGSGKTTVLVERYRSLIVDWRFEPREILAITFTEKAAANMKAKVSQLFRHDPPMVRELESAWISTIHGFCNRLLHENALSAGVDPRFRLLDAREAEILQYEALNAAFDEFTAQRRNDVLELIPALQTPDMAGDLMGVLDAIRSAGRTVAQVRLMPCPAIQALPSEMAAGLRRILAAFPGSLTQLQALHRAEMLEFAERMAACDAAPGSEVMDLVAGFKINLQRVPRHFSEVLREFRDALSAWAVDRAAVPYRAMVFDILERSEDLYAGRKNETGALDFNDLERCTITLLRCHPAVQEKIRRQFRQVMLDEFQDINEQQWELIQLLRAEDTFFAVGDENQSIYGFRHARPEIFHDYEAEVTARAKHSVALVHNFRSRPEILRTVESLLNGSEGIRTRELVARRQFPEALHPSVEILRVSTGDEEPGVREARWLAHRILALKRPFRDYAVLCRNSDSMRSILEALTQADIPYVCGRRPSFLLSREGLDLTALLHATANPRDSISLTTVLRSGLAGVSDEALLRLRVIGGSVSGGLNLLLSGSAKAAAFSPGFEADDPAKLARFGSCLRRWREQQPVVSLDLLISRILSDTGITVTESLEGFLRLARARGDGPLRQFLSEIESLQSAAGTENDLSDEDQGDCVQVMTAHAAKGLEFKVAIIAGMDRGTKRTSAPVTFTPAIGLGLKWRHSSKKKDGLPDSWHARNSEDTKQREDDEANRLLYVAMTRAEEHLVLSWSYGEGKSREWAGMVEKWLETDPPVALLMTPADGEPPPPETLGRPASVPAALITAPVVDGQHDSSVNVTSLTAFAACPRRYFLQRYVGWSHGGTHRKRFDPTAGFPEELPDHDVLETSPPAAELGSRVHEILAGRAGTYSAEAIELAAVFEQSDLGRRAAAATRTAREWDFIIDQEGTLVRGSIDLWFEEAGQIHIVDYKTDSKAAPAIYTTQLALYAHALERALGTRPATASLFYLRSGQVAGVPLDDAAIARALALVRQLRDSQASLTFPLHEGTHCHACPFYRGLCPASILNP